MPKYLPFAVAEQLAINDANEITKKIEYDRLNRLSAIADKTETVENERLSDKTALDEREKNLMRNGR